MRIYFTDQTNNLNKHLERLTSYPVMQYEISSLPEKVTAINIDTKQKIESMDLGFFFNYKIFPSNIMSFLTQWEVENRLMKPGDTIVQQAYLPPARFFSQKIIFGVRIHEIFDQPGKRGFSYETLEGHAEKGISRFTIEKIDHETIFKIQTNSGPGNFLSKLAGPFFTSPYQDFCTRKALVNVKNLIENSIKYDV